MSKEKKQSFMGGVTVLAISTVFVKQHSIIDVIAALPICAIAYEVCYRYNKPEESKKRIRDSV